MSARNSTSDTREFPNEFPDYDNCDPLFDSSTNQLKEEIAAPIRECVISLLNTLEKRINAEIKWNEYSVYTGTSGIALMYTHILNKKDLFKDLESFPVSDNIPISFIENSLPHLKKKHFSFMCGVPGPLAVGALIYHKNGNEKYSRDLYQRLYNLERDALVGSSDMPDELLYGRVGYLFSLLFLRQHIGKEEYCDKLIKEAVETIIKSGKHWAKKFKNTLNFPLYYEWHDKAYIGAAHGFAGILYLLLYAREFMSAEDLNNLLKPSIDLILSLQFPSGNFPSSLGNDVDRLIHWCHGAPGVIHLMLLAYEAFNEDKYLESARQCSDVIWKRGLLRKGYGLCHGVAGNGYALLRMYQVTKEKKYLFRALQFGKFCCSYGKHDVRTPDHPLSLMEGMAGTIYFLTDLLDPENAAFPAFQLA